MIQATTTAGRSRELIGFPEIVRWPKPKVHRVLVIEAILTSIELLGQFPQLGRPGRRAGTRELRIPRTPYTIIYQLAAQELS